MNKFKTKNQDSLFGINIAIRKWNIDRSRVSVYSSRRYLVAIPSYKKLYSSEIEDISVNDNRFGSGMF